MVRRPAGTELIGCSIPASWAGCRDAARPRLRHAAKNGGFRRRKDRFYPPLRLRHGVRRRDVRPVRRTCPPCGEIFTYHRFSLHHGVPLVFKTASTFPQSLACRGRLPAPPVPSGCSQCAFHAYARKTRRPPRIAASQAGGRRRRTRTHVCQGRKPFPNARRR